MLLVTRLVTVVTKRLVTKLKQACKFKQASKPHVSYTFTCVSFDKAFLCHN